MRTKAETTLPRRSNGSRWLIGLTILVVLLAVYAIALRWFALRLESDIQKSLRPVPVASDVVTPSPDA